MSGGWTALVPLRSGGKSKTRLASKLTEHGRSALVHDMARHVIDVLGRCKQIDHIVLLSPERPDWWKGHWALDQGRGLNAELTAWRDASSGPFCIIHADLPLIDEADVRALLDRAEKFGSSLATDRAGTGSNAIAVAHGQRIAFQFGPGSRARHEVLLPAGAVISRPGLATDIDHPADLALLPTTFLDDPTNLSGIGAR